MTFALGLVSGTFSAVLCKVAYDTTSTTLEGTTELFQKPICLLLLMFSGMVPAIFFWMIQQSFLEPEKQDKVSRNTLILLIIPCLCDLCCTLLLLIAQVYITASIWQMLRGTVIVITALLKRFLLEHKLRVHMWAGIAMITVSMLLVASVSIFFSSSSSGSDDTTVSSDPQLGVTLVMIGCLAQGLQYVFEEKVMSGDDNAPPLVVIGMEGLWGTVLTIFVIYPIAYSLPGNDMGSYENPFNSYHMIASSPALIMICIAFVLFVTCYNVSVIYVTKYLSSIWHAILDNFRPISIWMLDLCIFYYILPNSAYGEQWLNPGSWVQLAGLFVLLFGTAVYNGSVMLCDGEYQALVSESDSLTLNVAPTSVAMSSPSLSRSPLLRAQKLKDDYKESKPTRRYSQDV